MNVPLSVCLLTHAYSHYTPHAQGDPSLAKKGVAGVYGMVGMVPDKSVVTEFLTEFFNEVYS